MKPVDDLATRSDVSLLSEMELFVRDDECTQRIVAELRRRLYQLRKLEMFYHLGPAIDKPPVCRES